MRSLFPFYLGVALLVISPSIQGHPSHPPIGGQQDELCRCPGDEFKDPLPKITHIHSDSHQFIDEFGRSAWFHGTNIVSKSQPYHPSIGGPDVCNSSSPVPLCDADMDYLQDLGINVVRLGVMWPGAEPTRGEYDCSYFCTIHSIIQALAIRGIYTMIDVHQDVFAKQFCQEGVPDWFVQKDWIENETMRFPYPIAPAFTTDERGMPDPISQCWDVGANWFLTYFSFAVSDAFGRFYDNHDNLLDSFAAYWRKIALEFRKYPSVMGYNLLNEPWAGSIYKDPTLLIPGIADSKKLEHVWNEATKAIRTVDEDKIVFFEGVTWDLQSGFAAPPLNDTLKTALSYHYYRPPQLGLHVMFVNRETDQDRLGMGAMLTEFRTWAGEEGEDYATIDAFMKQTMDVADQYLQSWIGWGYRSVEVREESVAKHYARSYAPHVSGIVSFMKFDEVTGQFQLKWKANKSIILPTQIRLNKKYFYSNGYNITLEPNGHLEAREVLPDEPNYSGNVVHLVITKNRTAH